MAVGADVLAICQRFVYACYLTNFMGYSGAACHRGTMEKTAVVSFLTGIQSALITARRNSYRGHNRAELLQAFWIINDTLNRLFQVAEASPATSD